MNIGILDPTGKNLNPLTQTKYSDQYIKLAQIWKNFPAYEYANKFISNIKNNQVILVVSGTGSGKTVLVPKFALHTTDYKGKIAITLPKQIIAKSAAEFSSNTLDVKIGEQVGYQYKGASKCSDKTNLLYATDGTIVARLLEDPLLKEFDMVIIDEAHERKVQIDFLLYLLRNVITNRNDFKVIIMSATINAEIFETYFSKFAFKRMDIGTKAHYPIQSHFLSNKLKEKTYLSEGVDIILNILEKDNNDGSDILFFITSVNEAIDVCKNLNLVLETTTKKIVPGSAFCVEIYSGVNQDQQALAQDKDLFKKNTSFKNKIVVSTNVAESSLTIDGIKYIIDSGLELQSYYDPEIKADRLDRTMITKAQVRQRMGRSGRTKPGICYHLYTEKEYNSMSEYPEPTIRISDISSECLKLLSLDFVKNVPKLLNTLTLFIEPPKELYIKDALWKLRHLDLVDNNNLTQLGAICSKLSGFSPEEAISLLLSIKMECSHEVSKILSVIDASKSNIDTVFITPIEQIKNNESLKEMKQKLDKKFMKAKKVFYSQYGDHLSLLNVFVKFQNRYKKESDKKFNDWCYKYFINKSTMFKALKIQKKIKGKMRSGISGEILDQVGIIFEDQIKSLGDVDSKMRALFCLSIGYKLNKANKKGSEYVTDVSSHYYKISKSSFLNLGKSLPTKIVYSELFISMNTSDINIASKLL